MTATTALLTAAPAAPAPDGLANDLAAERARWRAFVDTEVAPFAHDFERAGAIPRAVLDRVSALGLWAAVVPTGRAGTMERFAALHEEIGRGCSSVRSLLTVHSMVTHAVHRWAAPATRAQLLPALTSGALLGAFCLTESGAGSEINAVAATARRDGSHYVIDGVKRWTTGGQIADLLLVVARTGERLTAFLVDAHSPGVRRTPVPDALGTGASMIADIELDGCRVPAANVLGRPGMGAALVAGALDIGRLSVAAGCVGIMDACLDACLDHASTRSQGGALLAEHQLVQRMITNISTDLRAARLLCGEAARLKDIGDPATLTATCVAKYFAAAAAMRAATDAVQVHGARGCGTHRVGRLFREAKVMEIIEGSSQIHQMLIAQAELQSFAAHRPVGGQAA